MNKYPWLDQHLRNKAGAEKDYKEEWGWHRYLVGGKMFAATCQPGPEHKGYDCRELISLKCEPERAELLRPGTQGLGLPGNGHPQMRSPSGRDAPQRIPGHPPGLLLGQAVLELRLSGRRCAGRGPAGSVRQIL